jgi:hypothetical protein
MVIVTMPSVELVSRLMTELDVPLEADWDAVVLAPVIGGSVSVV